MRSKKGQSAMEFIMTYGWAILVVLIVVGALVYFGVLSPSTILGARCTFPAKFGCIGDPLIDATNNQITLALVNNVGFGIVFNRTPVSQATGGGCASPVVHTVDGSPAAATISNGDQFNIVVNCTDIATGTFRTDLTFNYQHQQNQIWYPVTGEIRGRGE